MRHGAGVGLRQKKEVHLSETHLHHYLCIPGVSEEEIAAGIWVYVSKSVVHIAKYMSKNVKSKCKEQYYSNLAF